MDRLPRALELFDLRALALVFGFACLAVPLAGPPAAVGVLAGAALVIVNIAALDLLVGKALSDQATAFVGLLYAAKTALAFTAVIAAAWAFGPVPVVVGLVSALASLCIRALLPSASDSPSRYGTPPASHPVDATEEKA